MRITPLDVRKQEFKRVVRGADPDEVQAFLATVADEYEAVLTDNKQLREKVIELDEKVGEYRNMEKTLRDTLLTAERVMTEARQNARKEAELILRDAQLKASQATNNIEQRVDALRAQLRELRGQRDSFLARLQSLAEAQVGLVESYRKDFASDDDRSERLMRDPNAETPSPSPRPAPQPAPEITTPTSEVATPPPAEPVQLDPTPSAPRTPSASDDHWKDYRVGADASPRRVDPPTPQPGPEPPAPQDPSEPQASQDDEVNGTVEQVLAIHELALQEGPVSDDLFETGADDGGYDVPVEAYGDADQQADPSGQSEPGVPGSPYPEPTEPAWMQAEAAGAESTTDDPAGIAPEAEAAEGDEGGSRWSLSRFTRGLSGL